MASKICLHSSGARPSDGSSSSKQARPAHQRARRSPASAARRPTACRRADGCAPSAAETARNTRSRSSSKCDSSVTVAPICRFSSTVMRAKMRRPSGACAMRSRAISCVGRPVMSRPSNRMRALARARVAEDGHHQRRFAGAVGADHGDDLAVIDVEIDALERDDVAVIGLDAAHREQGAAAVAAVALIARPPHGRLRSPRPATPR